MLLAIALASMLDLPSAPPEENLPVSLAAVEPALIGADEPRLAVGVHLGWLQLKDAEDGEMFYGLHARLYLLNFLAVEGSVDFSKSDFADDDAELTLMPVQVTGLLFPLPSLPIRPYGLAGAGWYFQDVEYSGSLSGLSDDSDSTFGVHLGVGAELLLGRLIMLHADLRYIFMDEPDVDNSQLDDEEFDYWQVMIGGSLAF